MSSDPLLLLATAFGPEARPFREGTLEALPFRMQIAELGVGVVLSAIRATRALLDIRPSGLVFAGTCGAYPGSGLSIGDVVVARRASLLDLGSLDDGAVHVPSIYGARTLEMDGPLVDRMISAGARPAHVATTLSITMRDDLARRIRDQQDADVEHLEAQAIAAAARELSVPCAIVLGVANPVGARSHESWKENHVAVSATVAALVLSALR